MPPPKPKKRKTANTNQDSTDSETDTSSKVANLKVPKKQKIPNKPKTPNTLKTVQTNPGSADSDREIPSHVASLLKKIQTDRTQCAESVMDFNFVKKRVRVLTKATEVTPSAEGIVYWMSRDQRVQDNWAFLFAQKLALKNEVPLHVCFCLVTKFLDATIRHFDFMLKGLQEVEKECKELNIEFHLLEGQADDVLLKFINKKKIGALVTDFSPLRTPMAWVESVQKGLPEDIPLCQVDAHNIVPCWEASPKLEYGARTIRSKINNQLSLYLTQFPPLTSHPHFSTSLQSRKETDWAKARSKLEVDTSVGPVAWAVPGYTAGIGVVQSFLQTRLKEFDKLRNDPTKDNLSNLSPWFHFGQISVQRAILCAQEYKSKYSSSVAAFCEEAIIRRELADNFCFYNENYDKMAGTNEWAKKSLDAHRKDKREWVYTLEQLDQSKTHDNLWNAAQTQLVHDGKMHGFLRMYWAKKILEWTKSPDEALEYAIYLNDRYNLDGRDPNGYVGCMWSICGIHDQGWKERPVFGKIRYMNYQGCKRKFDVDLFESKWKKRK